jgi:diguanylate cyclase (GGDEF)-like protein/PAS domain S-box-containing protein
MKLLYIEDSPSDADLTRRTLERSDPEIELQVATTLSAGMALLEQPLNFDILLIDLHLPDGSGFEMLNYVREHSLSLAMIILTSSGDQESAIAALKAGADDYLAKGSDYLDRLPDILRSALARFRDYSERKNQILHVLFVENIQADVDMIKKHLALKSPHILITSAANAEDALEYLPDSANGTVDFDLLLVNYHLPGMDGLDLIRIVRQDRGLKVPIVLITSQGSEELAVRALQLGADDYLMKRTGYLNELAVTLENVKRQADLKFERASLKKANQRLNHLVTASPCMLFCLRVVDNNLIPVWISKNIEAMFGFTPIEALAPNWWVSHVYPDDRERVVAANIKILTESRYSQDYRFINREGHALWVREELRLVKDKRGKPLEVIGTWLDISQSKQVEAVQMARNAVLDQIVGNQKLPLILEDIAHRLEDINPDMIVSILLYDQTKGQLFVGAAPSLPDFFNDAVNGLEAGIGQGSCGTSVYTGEPVIVTDIDSHPYWASYLEITQRAGLHACWSLPIMDDSGLVIGSFAIYYATKRAPLPSELDLIGEFARITALAIQKVHAADALRQSAAVFESTRDGVVISDLVPRIVAINRAYTEITGYSEAEVLGKNPNILKSGVHDAKFHQAMWDSVKTTGHWQGEIWNRRKNGEIYAQWLTISTVLNELGQAQFYVGVFTDISQVKQSEARMEYLAHYDPLTQLPNRLLVQSRLEQAIERAERHNYRIAVLYIDLDRFKTVNDSLGHPVGDELLIALSQRLSTRLRDDDFLARLGGDEFLLVMEFVPLPEGAATLAQSLIDILATPFRLPSGHEVFVSTSIGISLYPDDAKTVTELIQFADLAMYQAKQDCRNTYHFHTHALTIAASERLLLETNLRHALERGEFVLHYQPFIDALSGHIIGLEALVWWQPNGSDLVYPNKFISIAEDTGLIVLLGEWVLRTACAQASAWAKDGLPPIIMAVNLSGRQFQSGKIVSLVRDVLKQTGLPAQQLELELTESIVMDQAEQAIKILDDLKALQVRLAIDDFGTGYSSLAYLTRFPIDKLKIDRSFVRDITCKTNAYEIVSTIIAMAKSLDLDVIAEGLETQQQLDFLLSKGCTQYQGDLFSKPLEKNEVKQMLLDFFGDSKFSKVRSK